MGASDFRNVIKAKTPEIGFKNLIANNNYHYEAARLAA